MSFRQAERDAWAHMQMRERLLLRLYRVLAAILPSRPVIAALRARAARHPDRESAGQVPQRLALDLSPRPDGPLIWLNAIGPGDATALLPLIRAFLEHDSATICLVTTRTASGQTVFARLGESKRVVTQLAPLDTRAAINRFLAHWKPSLAVFCEGDMWPNTLEFLHARAIPVALVNAQINGRLGKFCRKQPRLGRWMHAHVDFVHVFPEQDASSAQALFRPDCKVMGAPNLKLDAPPLTVSAAIINPVRRQWNGAPVLTCASVSNREVPVLLEAARHLRAQFPEFRLILVPRWTDQANEMASIVRDSNVPFSRRSVDKIPQRGDQVFIADSYGEMGNWIELSFAVFMGNTLFGGHGHNPFEPISQQRVILTGGIPHLLQADYQYLVDLGLCHVCGNAEAIADTAMLLWQGFGQRDNPVTPLESARGFAVRMASYLCDLASLAPERGMLSGALMRPETGQRQAATK